MDIPAAGALPRDEGVSPGPRGALPYWCIWPNKSAPKYIVRTNRDIVPQIPPTHVTAPRYCIDGRLGLFDDGQFPQRHVDGKWHMAFIPLATPSSIVPFHLGRPWWYHQLGDMSGDLGHFLLQEDLHLQHAGPGLARLDLAIRQRMLTTMVELQQQLSILAGKRAPHSPCPEHEPRQIMRDLNTITATLRNNALKRWELKQIFALWQRNVNEVKGWIEYERTQAGRLWPDTHFVSTSDAAGRAQIYRATRHVRPYRGVFVSSEHHANIYASHDVSVWQIIPYTPELRAQLEEHQRLGNICRAYYRKYGSTFCPYIDAVEQRFTTIDPGPPKCLDLSRSANAYSQQNWDSFATDDAVVVAAVELGLQHNPASFPPDQTSSPPGEGLLPQRPLNTGLQCKTLLARAPVPQAKTAKYAQVEPLSPQGPPPHLQSTSKLRSKKRRRKGDASDDEVPPPRKSRSRRTVKKLAKEMGVVAKSSQIRLNPGDPSTFISEARPVWFPVTFKIAEDITRFVNSSRERIITLNLDRYPVPHSLLAAGRLYKVPLVSYFVNVWQRTRESGYSGLKLKSGGRLRDTEESKKTEEVVSKLFLVWAKFRPFYLRKLSLSPAEDIPGLMPTQWRNTLKLVLPLQITAATIVAIGLDACLPVPESEIVCPPDEEEEEPAEAALGASAAAVTSPSSSTAAIVSIPHAAGAAPQPLMPINLPPVLSAPLPTTIGELFDRLPHPSFQGLNLPEYQFTEEEDGGWPSVPWRRFWLWELREIEFRHELLALDLTIRQLHPNLEALQALPPEERHFACKACWGGTDFTPGSDDWAQNDLVHVVSRIRLSCLAQFATFMKVWPRVDELLGPWEPFLAGSDTLDGVGCASELFLELENSVWLCYAQTFYDYRHRLAPVPFLRPPLPL